MSTLANAKDWQHTNGTWVHRPHNRACGMCLVPIEFETMETVLTIMSMHAKSCDAKSR